MGKKRKLKLKSSMNQEKFEIDIDNAINNPINSVIDNTIDTTIDNSMSSIKNDINTAINNIIESSNVSNVGNIIENVDNLIKLDNTVISDDTDNSNNSMKCNINSDSSDNMNNLSVNSSFINTISNNTISNNTISNNTISNINNAINNYKGIENIAGSIYGNIPDNELCIDKKDNILNNFNLDNFINKSVDFNVNDTINNTIKETNLDNLYNLDNEYKITEGDKNPGVDKQFGVDNISHLTSTISLMKSGLKIPDIKIENDAESEKSEKSYNVSFSPADINNLRLNKDVLPALGNGNNSLTSGTSGSEFSFTKAIKSTKAPRLLQNATNKIIRTQKMKIKKKIPDLDEVDYLHNKLQNFIRNVNINISNYSILIVKAMEIVENANNSTCDDIKDIRDNFLKDKKSVVEKAIQRLLLIDLDITDLERKVILATMNNIIDLFIVCTRIRLNNNDKYNFQDNLNESLYANNGQIIHSLVDKLTTIVLKRQYTAERIFVNIATLTELLINHLELYKYLTGYEKKIIVIQTMDLFIKRRLEYVLEIHPELLSDITKSLDAVPGFIDIMIALQKGKYKINSKLIPIKHNIKQNIKKKKNFCKKILCCCF